MQVRQYVSLLMCLLMISPAGLFAANHREAPITSVDRAADITDWYAFVSYDDPSKVTMILSVDPLLEPGNGPNYFPFDDSLVYRMYIDNNYDAEEDVYFEFRFKTEIRNAAVPVAYIGAGAGINAPANQPNPAVNGLLIPPAITSLTGAGAAGIAIRQSYTVTLNKGNGQGQGNSQGQGNGQGNGQGQNNQTDLGTGKTLYAVPSNVGPRTMPTYAALAKSGVYDLGQGIKVWAGTSDDPFYIDLGGVFDSFNLRADSSFLGIPGVVSKLQDLNDTQNYAADTVSGYNVNTIAIEVPIAMLTRDSKSPVIGTWGATLRSRVTVRKSPDPLSGEGGLQQVQRMGNPLINELIIGNGSKDKFSMSQPKDDAQFASFALDPVLARVLNAVAGINVPNAPRTDLLLLVTYAAPIAPAGTPAGPPADMLRLNTSIPATAAGSRKRMAVLAGDLGGWPNGRRISDDVTDIALRAVAGVLAGGQFATGLNAQLGDGVNVNDMVNQETFPYVAWAQSGRSRRHVDPGEVGCAQGNGLCPK